MSSPQALLQACQAGDVEAVRAILRGCPKEYSHKLVPFDYACYGYITPLYAARNHGNRTAQIFRLMLEQTVPMQDLACATEYLRGSGESIASVVLGTAMELDDGELITLAAKPNNRLSLADLNKGRHEGGCCDYSSDYSASTSYRIHLATAGLKVDCLRALLAAGVPPDTLASSGHSDDNRAREYCSEWTALHVACRLPPSAAQLRAVELLLAAGAEVDKREPGTCNKELTSAWTGLHLAIKSGSLPVAAALLRAGADPTKPMLRCKTYTAPHDLLMELLRIRQPDGVPLHRARRALRLALGQCLLRWSVTADLGDLVMAYAPFLLLTGLATAF